MFPAETYAARRRVLAERIGDGLIVLVGLDLEPMNYADNPYPFWQDRSFLYYFGLDEPGLVGVLDAATGRATLFGHEPTLEEVVWMGPQPSLAERAERIGVPAWAPAGRFAEWIGERQREGAKLHFLPAFRASTRQKIAAWLGQAPGEVDGLVSRRLVEAVVAQRAVKSDEEVREIEAAMRITRAMHLEAMRVARPGVAEWEVAGAVEGAALRLGGRLSFPVIFSRRGEILHNHHYGNTLAAGDLVVHDSGGAAPSGYAGDITRTLPVGGRFDGRQRDVYRIVLEAETRAIEEVGPSVRYLDVHRFACRILAEGLAGLGLMRGDPAEAVEAGAHALFMPHGLGHMMGLDVHDMEGLDEDLVGYGDEMERSDQFGTKSLRLARTLEPGFVLTVEPGIYFIPPLIDRWRAEGRHAAFLDYDAIGAWKDFGGVRIEDDVLVTPDGRRVLGEPIPKA
ncbi:MAG: aminopeptidase P family protein, partial [Gemmatimonadota bacterium]|nr:aminopeptidase P family protein [Gemmatimonadota bacterium]